MFPLRLACWMLPLVLLACQAERPEAPAEPEQPDASLDPRVPESWVRPVRSPVYWTIWADVWEFVDPRRRGVLDIDWMDERARSDLATVTPEDDYDDEFLLSGIWRFGLLREEVMAAIAVREPEPIWPLERVDRQLCRAWRPRLERWERAHSRAELAAKLEATWRNAVAAGDVGVAARVVEARKTWLAQEGVAEMRPAAEVLIRHSLADYRRLVEKDWRDGRLPPGLLYLMEQYGVPEGVDLEPIVDAARKYFREMSDESIPLPHPYDLHLAVLRIERLSKG